MPLRCRKTVTSILAALACIGVLAGGGILGISGHIESTAAPRLYEDLESIPTKGVGLVLGTSRNRGDGVNEFYAGRIKAAAELYFAGRVSHIIVSGSHPSRYYDEPFAMKRDLVAAGVPADCITEDGGGLRTLDSVVRAHSVMGLETFTIVSQRSHAARAVYIGMRRGLDVVAYCAPDILGPFEDGVGLREYGARVRAFLDVMVLGTQPTLRNRQVPESFGLAARRKAGGAS